jgi:hypothetical protein
MQHLSLMASIHFYPHVIITLKDVAGPEFNKEHANFFFFVVKGFIHREFVPPNTTVNFDFSCDILRCLRENVQ